MLKNYLTIALVIAASGFSLSSYSATEEETPAMDNAPLETTEGSSNQWQFKTSKVYFGGGLGGSSINGIGDAITLDGFSYQVFTGYILPVKPMNQLDIAVEVGLYNSGSMDFDTGSTKASGVWIDGVISGPIQEKLDWLGRIGFDLGDDDGLMFGGGVKYLLTPTISLQAELILRNNIDSMMFSATIPFDGLFQ